MEDADDELVAHDANSSDNPGGQRIEDDGDERIAHDAIPLTTQAHKHR